MHYTQHWPLYLFILLPLVLTAKPSYKAKQCLRYRDNDIFAETCPAYSQGTVDFSAALFPDAAVISDLSKPNIIEKPIYNDPAQLQPDNAPEEPVKATNAPPSTQTSDNDTRQTQQPQENKESRPHSTINDTKQQQQPDNTASSNNEKRKPLVSFEEWQKKIAQIENDKERRHKRKTLEDEGDGSPNKKQQQMVDSIDGGFADDFGSMFEDLLGGVGGKDKKKPNVYAEGEYIAPSQSASDSKNKKKQQFADVRMKSLKERFNYASTDCAATVRKVNKQAKGAQSILYESKDQYLLNKCSADKFVIINLCEEIVVDTIVMANFEFFSSTFKDFRVYASSKYPTNDWRLLGQWQARNTRDLQVFKVPYSGFLEYMKIEFLTHYGHEYYCPLSLVRVHGMPMLEFYNTVESKDQYPVLEEEHLWPAEVREQIIQPQFDVNDTAESFPVKIDVDEDDVKPIIPPINIATETLDIEDTLPTLSDTTLEVKAVKTIVKESAENDVADQAMEEETGIAEITITQVISQTENSVPITPSDTGIDSSDTPKPDSVPVSSSSPSPSSSSASSGRKKAPSKSKSKKTKNAADKGSSTKKASTSTSDTTTSNTVKSSSSETTDSSADTASSQIDREASPSDSTEIANNSTAPPHHVNVTVSSTSSTTIVLPQSPLPVPQQQQPKPMPPNVHQKEGSTQESIYKTIMKRLNVLEVNMTLSQRFLDEQNKILNDVFMDMEKRHQDQLILLIGHLNETASFKIDSMKRRYEQWYEDLKDQTESDMREMTAKISILADQLSFERRVSVSQLVIMVTLFVFMALSRGTFNTLSPVMAAQQEERKRRESIDQSSSLSKETLDLLQKSSDSAPDATVPSSSNPTPITEEPKPSIIRKLSELPKKPNNPRRHSDSPYHTMGSVSNKEDGVSRKSSYESLGIELHNELLHKKLDDLSQQQQQQQQQRPSLINDTSRKSSLENLQESSASFIVKNRKRSSTSPPSSAIVP